MFQKLSSPRRPCGPPPAEERSPFIYFDRIVDCYCNHRNSGSDAVAGIEPGARQGESDQLYE